jgi:hypothetical protein
LRVICIYLVFLQPLVLSIIPLILYDQHRLPGTESIYMLSVSVGAWRNMFLTIYGIFVGVMLWRRRPAAPKMVQTYLLVSLASASALLILPFVIPFHSYLRKPVRVEQAEGFLQTLLVFAICYSYLMLSKRVRATYPEPPTDGPPFTAGTTRRVFAPFTASLMGVSLLGLSLSAAAFFTTPIDLFEAAWEGDLRMIERLVADGADVNITTGDLSIPLHLARTREVAEFLVSTSSKVEESYLLTAGAFKNLPRLILKLRAHSDPVSQYLWSRFSTTTQQVLADPGLTLEQVQPCLIDGLNKILHDHLAYDSRRFVGVTLSEATLRLKSQEPHGLELVHFSRLLLEDAYPGEIDKYHIEWRNCVRDTPLHLAAWNGRPEVALVLVGHGADLNVNNSFGMTPLDYALFAKAKRRQGSFDAVIALLVQRGGRANTQADKLNTLLVSNH